MLAIPLCQQVYNCKKKFLKFITKKEASVSEDLLCDQSCLNSLGNNGFKSTLYVWRTKLPASIFVIFNNVETAWLVVDRADGISLFSVSPLVNNCCGFFICAEIQELRIKNVITSSVVGPVITYFSYLSIAILAAGR